MSEGETCSVAEEMSVDRCGWSYFPKRQKLCTLTYPLTESEITQLICKVRLRIVCVCVERNGEARSTKIMTVKD